MPDDPTPDAAPLHHGACLCGQVRFTVRGALAAPWACHCVQCRKQSGHYWASTEVPRERLLLQGEEHLRWYQSSAKVRRGFCQHCGSFLFWDPPHKDWTAVAMGAFDGPTQTQLARHIFVARQGDYYTLNDGVPQNEA